MNLRLFSLQCCAQTCTVILVAIVALILIVAETYAVDDEEPEGTSLKFIDKEVADACIRCLCDYRKSCNKTTCTGDKLGVSGYFCGPFRISKPYWNDAGRVEIGNETSKDEMKIFEHCTTNYDCSEQVVLAYSKRYMTDCDGDGAFTCADIIRLHDMGPECKGDVPMETSNRLDRINQCYVRLTGNPINPGRGISSTGSSSLYSYIAAGAGTFVLLIFIVAGLANLRYWLIKREQRCPYADSEQEDGLKKTLKREGGDSAINLPLTSIIPPDELIIYQEKRLGQGQFGLVVQGLYNGSRVAVKIPKLSLIVSSSTIEDFEKELEMMARVGSHSNIVTFFGAEISQIRRGIVHVVLEFCRFGSLLNFMRTYEKNLSHPGEIDSSGYANLMPDMAASRDEVFTVGQLKLKWGYQLANALAFLESQKVLHGDVAARNVLVFELSVVKLSDFGFARWLGGYDDYEKREGPMPWRWMAPESLERRLFSLKSDVWSFGVTLWEIFTFGVVPYLDWDNCNYNFVAGLKENLRLQRPEGARTEIYSLMLRCWELSPEDRPTFEELEKWLASLADSNECTYEESVELSKSNDA